MIRFQRNLMNVDSEARGNSRIEFHHPVVILGIDTMARILDFSLGGFYITSDQVAKIKQGQRLSLALRLPDEKAFMSLKAQVVHTDKKGFGCKLIGQNHEIAEALERCFEIFSGTLPLE